MKLTIYLCIALLGATMALGAAPPSDTDSRLHGHAEARALLTPISGGVSPGYHEAAFDLSLPTARVTEDFEFTTTPEDVRPALTFVLSEPLSSRFVDSLDLHSVSVSISLDGVEINRSTLAELFEADRGARDTGIRPVAQENIRIHIGPRGPAALVPDSCSSPGWIAECNQRYSGCLAEESDPSIRKECIQARNRCLHGQLVSQTSQNIPTRDTPTGVTYCFITDPLFPFDSGRRYAKYLREGITVTTNTTYYECSGTYETVTYSTPYSSYCWRYTGQHCDSPDAFGVPSCTFSPM